MDSVSNDPMQRVKLVCDAVARQYNGRDIGGDQAKLELAYDALVQRIKAGASFCAELNEYIVARLAVEPDAVQTGDYQQSACSWFDIVPPSHLVIVISCDECTRFASNAIGSHDLFTSHDTPAITNGLAYACWDKNSEIKFMSLPQHGPDGKPFPLPPVKQIFWLKKRSVNKTPKIKGETTMASKKTNPGAISIAELKDLLRDNLNALWENDPALHTKHADASMMIPPVMVWGAPGVGKSTAVRELTKELGIGFIDVRLAQREPVDMRGLPVPDEKENSVKWLVSGEWPRDPKSRGIIMFDELTAADKTLQVAAYEFILDRRLGALYSVPPGWYIMAAGNRTEDRAVACAMSSALANRFSACGGRGGSEQFSCVGEGKQHPSGRHQFHQDPASASVLAGKRGPAAGLAESAKLGTGQHHAQDRREEQTQNHAQTYGSGADRDRRGIRISRILQEHVLHERHHRHRRGAGNGTRHPAAAESRSPARLLRSRGISCQDREG